MRNLDEIIIHCTATHSDWRDGQSINEKVTEVRRWHVDLNGWRDIGYHFLIDRDGSVLSGRPITETGAHTKGHNTGSVGIALFGGATSAADDDFAENFTVEQETALVGLIDGLLEEFPSIGKISGHNQYAAKACPGFSAPNWWAGVQEKLAAAKQAEEPEVENIFADDHIEFADTSTADLIKARDLINKVLEQVNV